MENNKNDSNEQNNAMQNEALKSKNHAVKIAAVVIITALLAVLFIVMGISPGSTIGKADTLNVNLYFIDPAEPPIKAEVRKISDGTKEEIVKAVLEELILGPNNTLYSSSVPADMEMNAEIKGENVEIQLSEKYELLSDTEKMYLKASLVYTLTDLDFVESVTIYADGKQVEGRYGQPSGELTKDNVKIDASVSPDPLTKQTVILYFADDQGIGLVEEEREIEYYPNQIEQKCKVILEQLMAGPVTQGLVATIPPDTKIKVEVISMEGICLVNFSSEFSSMLQSGSTLEELTIYSIVNSLTEDKSITKVQFLIDGEKLDDNNGHMDLSKPFERRVDEQ